MYENKIIRIQVLRVRLSRDCLKLLRTEESSGSSFKKELVPKRPFPLPEAAMLTGEREKGKIYPPGVHRLEIKRAEWTHVAPRTLTASCCFT